MRKLGILALGLAFSTIGSAAIAQPSAVTVQVYSFGFAPQPLRLAGGRPVTLRFVNSSGSHHDFTAHSFFQHATITAGAAPDGEIELMSHETRTITVIPTRGTYHAHCSHFFHKQLGMRDEIVVD